MEEGIYLIDPALAAKDQLGIDLDSWQKDVITTLFRGEKKRVSVRAGHGVGKCNYFKDLAMLANGEVTEFKELVGKKFEVLSVDDNLNIVKTWAYATDNGNQPVWRVTTDKGREITRTENHPLWHRPCLFKAGRRPKWKDPLWVAVSELETGDLVCVPEALPVQGTIPIDEWKVKLLAYLIGDGCLSQNTSIVFSQSPGPQINEVREIVESVGLRLNSTLYNGCDYRIAGDRGKNNNFVLRWLREIGVMGKKSGDHKFPDCIWTLPNFQLAIFLSRLFSCDGWVCLRKSRHRQSGEIGFVSKSERLVRDVHLACLRFGIAGTISKQRKSWTYKGVKKSDFYWTWAIRDTRSLIKFINLIGIFGKEKACKRVIEDAEKKFTTRQKNDGPSRYAKPWEGDEKRAYRWPFYGLPEGLKWEKIRSIEYLGEKLTVAVTVPATHTYLTTFVEHNSFTAAVITQIFLNNYPGARVLITGPTSRQTRLQIWGYQNQVWQTNFLKDKIEWLKTKMYIKGYEESWFAAWVTSKNPKNAEGFHGENLLWIIEEAKTVQDAVFEGIQGALSQINNFIYISSTCSVPHGYFYETHTSRTDMWDTFHIPSWKSPRVAPERIESWRKEWGEDNPIFQARVAAEFPDEDSHVIVPLSHLFRAVEDNDSEDIDFAA